MILFYNHILLEAYCTKDDKTKCSSGRNRISAGCFAEQCEYLSYTEAPSEIMISDKDGVSICDIGFGGDMETSETERDKNIQLWENICKTKIEEAYNEYMEQKMALS